MILRGLLFAANVWLAAYALDAGFSLAESVFRSMTGSTALLAMRQAIAAPAAFTSLLVVPATVLSPRLVRSVILPPALGLLWLSFGAVPLPFFLEATALGLAGTGLQALFTVYALRRNLALSRGRTVWLGAEEPRQAGFSFGHTLRTGLALVLVGVPALVVSLPLWLLVSLQAMSGGFVRFDSEGVALADRVYDREDREVRLVGMMHIGEGEAYESLVASFAGPSTVVLAEGVTDREVLLDEPYSYGALADVLGLQTQLPMEAYFEGTGAANASVAGQQPVIVHADLDLSDFHPRTVRLLARVGEFWQSDDPAVAFGRLYRNYLEEPVRWKRFEEDILGRRNRHLAGKLEEAIADYRTVIVPWGAMHLPFMEREVERLGFEPRAASYRRLVSWSTIAAALLKVAA